MNEQNTIVMVRFVHFNISQTENILDLVSPLSDFKSVSISFFVVFTRMSNKNAKRAKSRNLKKYILRTTAETFIAVPANRKPQNDPTKNSPPRGEKERGKPRLFLSTFGIKRQRSSTPQVCCAPS